MSEERISLDNIRTVEAWEVLKRLIGEQKENTTMPSDIREAVSYTHLTLPTNREV